MNPTFRKAAEEIHRDAVAQGLVAYAAQSAEDPSETLLKICERGVDGAVLLEVKILSADRFQLRRHRTASLTRRFSGRLVNRNWMRGFLNGNPRGLSEAERLRVERINKERSDHVAAPHGTRHRDDLSEQLGDWREMKK